MFYSFWRGPWIIVNAFPQGMICAGDLRGSGEPTIVSSRLGVGLRDDAQTLVALDGVSKKFCKNLKRSLWYGLKDLAADCIGSNHDVRELRKDEFWALQDVSLTLKRGEVVSLVGSNGAGKTSLLKLINGLIRPDRGRITVRGQVGALIALGAGFNPILSGRENIYVNGAVLGIPKSDIDCKINSIIEFAELKEFIDMPVQSYSSGMYVRLGFSVAIHLEPDIFLIDEVLSVGDQSFNRKSLRKSMEIVQSRGTGIFFVSHSLFSIRQISTRVVWIDRGMVKMDGPPDEVLEAYQKTLLSKSGPMTGNELVKKYAYLGSDVFFPSDPIAQFSETVVKDVKGNPATSFRSGDSLVIESSCALKVELQDAFLVLRLVRTDGLNLWYYMVPKASRTLGPGSHPVTLKVNPLQLPVGTYILSVRLLAGALGVACAQPIELTVESGSQNVYSGLSVFEPRVELLRQRSGG